MFYPKEIFCFNEDITRANMRAYDRKWEKWQKAARELYPNYDNMTLRERLEARHYINEYVGYSM